MIRVAFTLIGGKNWTGGHNYLLNLMTVLTLYQAGRLTPVLFIGNDCIDEAVPFSGISGLELVHTPHLNAKRRKVSLAEALLWGQDVKIRRLFKKNRIDLVFEAAQFFGWRIGIPSVAWIPDFQHKVMAHLFSRTAWWKREIGFRSQVVGGRMIMLSSEDARRACELYYPMTRGRTRTVSFALPCVPKISTIKARAIADFYGLPERFIFLPNQFWKHKNHCLVLDALSILRERGKKIVVAAAGKQADPRDPGYFLAFKNKLEKFNLRDEFVLLGLIPYQHVRALMSACTAMLNPSLSEGWSTTVEEARAIGVPMLLSDLDVHREQGAEQAIYFDRNSAESLADAMDFIAGLQEVQRERIAEALRKNASQRAEKFALDFIRLAESCLK